LVKQKPHIAPETIPTGLRKRVQVDVAEYERHDCIAKIERDTRELFDRAVGLVGDARVR
jgi:hypothetical protein